MTDNDRDHDRDPQDKIAEIEARRADERDDAAEGNDLSSATEDIDLGSAADSLLDEFRKACEDMQPAVKNFAEQAQQISETLGPTDDRDHDRERERER